MNKRLYISAAALLLVGVQCFAQGILPPALNGGKKTQDGSVTTATYTIGGSGSSSATNSNASVVSSSRPAVKSVGVTDVAINRAKVPLKTFLVPVADRERPAAKISSGYDDAIRINIHFRVNSTVLEPSYLENSEMLSELCSAIDGIGGLNIKSVEVVSKASPEGPENHNLDLAEGRARAVCSYIEKMYPSLEGLVTPCPDGESWDELRKYVQRDRNLSQASRNAVVSVIDSRASGRKESIKKLGVDPESGDIYKYLLQNYYTLIRNTAVYITRK